MAPTQGELATEKDGGPLELWWHYPVSSKQGNVELVFLQECIYIEMWEQKLCSQ